MKIRKKTIAPVISEYFQYEKNYEKINHNLYFNTQIFNAFVFICTVIAISIVLGFFKPFFWAVANSCIALLLFLYQKTSKISRGVSISREVQKNARERSELMIVYLVSNETGFSIEGLSFNEEFDGVIEGFFNVETPIKIPANTQVRITKNIFLNSGMGIKTFRPIRLSFRDDLGIFDFKVEFQQEQEIEVFPVIEKTPAFKNSVSPDSIEFGLFEISKRGDSNLFIGTREYRRGDPVKNINWKLSKKTQKLVINEYEKSTNTFITLILELNIKNQSGLGEISTWELAKDLALSICQNEIKKNNHIQVVSSNLYIPFGTGERQLTLVEKHFTFHDLEGTSSHNYKRYLSNLPSNGQVYFICPPLLTDDLLQTFEILKRLKADGHNVIVFTLDPFNVLASKIKGKLRLSVLEMKRYSDTTFEKLAISLELAGIPLIPISITKNSSLNDQIVASLPDQLEVK